MSWDDAGTIFLRLCFSGPLLYIGLIMATQPASFVQMLQTLADELRSFEQRYLGQHNQSPLPADASLMIHRAVRAVGITLCIGALLPLTGLLG